ncbi:DUF397 domain-containing protein [Streptomyces sp. NPDC093808]|uniref:DUF397 domain-containing protein n=1 Tax=Streptomyces sp. NPDC093808 TaxID=3154985 RepID=UPI00344FF917
MRVHRQANSLGSKTVTGGANGNDCVEVAVAPGTVRVRDSKAQAEAVLAFPGSSEPSSPSTRVKSPPDDGPLGVPRDRDPRHPESCRQPAPRANCSRISTSWSRSVRPSGKVSRTCTPS